MHQTRHLSYKNGVRPPQYRSFALTLQTIVHVSSPDYLNNGDKILQYICLTETLLSDEQTGTKRIIYQTEMCPDVQNRSFALTMHTIVHVFCADY